MEYLGGETSALGKILCCQCGVPIESNAANMCVGCIRTTVDITEGIPKQGSLYFCKMCERYLQPPAQWVKCPLESRELLALCLKKLKGLEKVRLVDAGFVWTEPHSKRIKVKLTVQAEVLGGAILQQIFIVEFVVNNQMCNECHRNEAKDFWRALVQVRQRSDDKKTFYYLEQLILKYKAHENVLGIKPNHEGLDFFFATEPCSRKMIDFLLSMVPCRYQQSKRLISHDIHSNLYNYKHTFSVEIVPVSKDSVICLHAKLAHQLGGIGQICVVYRVANTIHLVDPTTTQIAEINSTAFWRQPFGTLCHSKQLVEFTIMDVEVIKAKDRVTFSGQGALSTKHIPADAWVVRSDDLGSNEPPIHCKTHLGHLLKPGDTVLGVDLANRNVNDGNFEKMRKERIPDIVLVKKIFGDKSARNRFRKWKLKHLNEMEVDRGSVNRDYVEFLEDLEEDPTLRQNVNIYKDASKVAVTIDETYMDEIPRITLEEMLDDLHLDEGEGDMG